MRIATVLILLLALAAVLTVRTRALPSAAPVHAAVDRSGVDAQAVAERLSEAVRIPTISRSDGSPRDDAAFEAFAALLAARYPQVHARLGHQRVGAHSLLYTWPGRDAALKPVLLLAHMDVVPVEPGTEGLWTHAPFSGDIADGFVWGRGTLDDKSSLMAWMEAAEQLLAKGFQPSRTILFAFGHDEEIGGADGAAKIAELLKSRGIVAEFALDEGGAITRGIVPGVAQPVASIMAAEKGYVSFRLTARGAGGHSSMPPKQTAAGQLARAVARVQDQPMPARLAAPTTDMLERLSPAMPLVQRVAIANRWLFEPLLVHLLGQSAVGDALLRTTTAPTMLRSGVKDNVLPSEAWAVVNFRLLPGDSIEAVEQHLRAVIADPGIEIAREGQEGNEASPVSRTDTRGFRIIERSVNEVYPDAIVSSGIVVGTTDLRNYAGRYVDRYNFAPTPLAADDLVRIHGSNERIAIADYRSMVVYAVRLIENLDLP